MQQSEINTKKKVVHINKDSLKTKSFVETKIHQ